MTKKLESARRYRDHFANAFYNRLRDLIGEAFGLEGFCGMLFLPFNSNQEGLTSNEIHRIEHFCWKLERLAKDMRRYISAERIGNIVIDDYKETEE